MNLKTKFVILSMLIASAAVRSTTGEKAVQLLKYDEETKKFQLKPDALSLVSSLKQPIQVISAVGDARLGKSTALNFVRSYWKDNGIKQIAEESFLTSDSFERCTQGIWISALEDQLKNTTVLLMDVEGTDLGDNGVTDHLSIFTALMSSGMTVFVRDTIKNHVIDFLYRVSRLSEVIFKEQSVENFPRLRVVLRTQLEPPSREKLKYFVADALIKPIHKDGLNEQRKTIAKHFPREHIEASLIPHVSDNSFLKDLKMLEQISYLDGIRNLTREFQQFPSKRTLGGGLMDGEHLKLLATKLVDAMNKNNSWLDFGNVYLNIEKHLCDRSHEKFVTPLQKEKADTIEKLMEERLRSYKDECALPDKLLQTKREIQKMIANKREFEKLQINLQKEQQKVQQALQEALEEEEKFRKEMDKKELEIQDEKQRSTELNVKLETVRLEHTQIMDRVKNLRSKGEHLQRALEEAKSGDNGSLGAIVAGVTAGLAAMAWMSDIRLKQNITALEVSEYECLGLQSVQWEWDEAAEKFGLTGVGRGLIAQEVERVLPAAVVTGSEGYKRVRYGLLANYRDALCIET